MYTPPFSPSKTDPNPRRASSSNANALGCWVFTGSRNTDGYSQIFTKPNSRLGDTGRGAQRAFLLHVISFVSKDPDIPHDPQAHVSHLCDVRACFNPDHLCQETSRVSISPLHSGDSTDQNSKANNSRKGCIGAVRCACSTAEICTHSPPCIRVAKNVLCCPQGAAVGSKNFISRRTRSAPS